MLIILQTKKIQIQNKSFNGHNLIYSVFFGSPKNVRFIVSFFEVIPFKTKFKLTVFEKNKTGFMTAAELSF